MNGQSEISVNAPSLPKGGGAIQSIGKGADSIGPNGAATYEIALPISPGRDFAPSLALSYQSSAGNSVFGIGWAISLPVVARRTSKGVPTYTQDDEIVGPGGVVWLPERDTNGALVELQISKYNELQLDTAYSVVRHFPRVERTFERIEHWSSETDKAGFWLIHGADGSLHLYGKNASSRRADPLSANRVAEWLLEESMNAHGEHIVYRYKPEVNNEGPTAQRYLSDVCYGNFAADAHLYSWKEERLKTVEWHFEMLFDYGERSIGYTGKPSYTAQQWLRREDSFSSFAYGFELRTERLCHQVLMFHRFPCELGVDPVLVRRLLLEYRQTPLGYHHLCAAHEQAFSESATADNHPPVEFSYSPFNLNFSGQRWQPFDHMPGFNDGQRYQLVDLYGEGLPGILYASDNAWLYREPTRAKGKQEAVAYGQWHTLPAIPMSSATKKSLSDLTGDGRLDWVISRPGLHGVFSLNPDRTWSNFAAFSQFPLEFFNLEGQLADLTGQGFSDLTLIGPRSVRLYTNQREGGFAAAREVPRALHDDSLPVLRPSPAELVAFSDVLGSGQQHLVRIRHNEVKCWPNMGHGRFGNGIVLGSLNIARETFDASRIRLADLDGSGATDLIYLDADHAQIFMNRCGNGFDAPIVLPWPASVKYDRLCQVSVADLQGLGCSSLILSSTHEATRHWRYDFISAKPYLLTGTNNNMGAAISIDYRSSAQEWLDEKEEELKADRPPICHVPFALPVVSKLTRLDEITGNRSNQSFSYRKGYYDGIEREFRGFGLLEHTDREETEGSIDGAAFTPSFLQRRWFHTGQNIDMPRTRYNRADKQAVPLGKTLLCQYSADIGSDTLIQTPDELTILEMARALSGYPLRTELFGLDKRSKTRTLYSIEENRFLIRQLQPRGIYQRYARLLPLQLEAIRYQYENVADDPQCQHTINLQHDAYGALTHSLNVHYARRKTVDDTPPYSDEDPQKWWRDAHDPEQQFYYLTETRAAFIHLDQVQGWRLGLPYRQRINGLKFPKLPETDGLTAKGITYEKLVTLVTSAMWMDRCVLTGLSVQRYRHASNPQTLPDGIASFEALIDHVETAELDRTAFSAFDVLPQASRPKGGLLERSGYQRMSDFFPECSTTKLWSVKSAFVTYAAVEGFYRPKTFQPSKSLGVTELRYDNRYCFITEFKGPDRCITKANHDYRTFQPKSISDPNGNVQEGLYNGFGQLLVSSFHRYTNNKLVGFKPVTEYQRPAFESPENAITQEKAALQNAASASYYAPMSWMGRVSDAALADPAWLNRCVSNHDLLPTGHIRSSARTRLANLQRPSVDDDTLQNELAAAPREPVHMAVLVCDRFPDDDQKQIRLSVTDFDGFGRMLQNKQKVEPGIAFVVNDQGQLTSEGTALRQQATAQRWRVSERVEYSDKGLPIRIYRPYFADQHRYVDDASLRAHGCHDEQFYDPLERLACTRLAKQNGVSPMRRYTRHPWYTVYEDENDTLEEVMSELAKTTGGEA
ncbi:SpvB/TcaC N-terminal domain-containing protein [Pseudomonas lini]|uniref:SpvB/TcaC N-terminal domain-containing protein n=1 Tax=Pseudomonas lini TaxID=163011 RepID=UPI00345EF8CF